MPQQRHNPHPTGPARVRGRRARPAESRAEPRPGARPPRHRAPISTRAPEWETGEACHPTRPAWLRKNESLGAARRVDVAQDPAALRDGFDEFGAAAGIPEFLAQLGDEDVDDL